MVNKRGLRVPHIPRMETNHFFRSLRAIRHGYFTDKRGRSHQGRYRKNKNNEDGSYDAPGGRQDLCSAGSDGHDDGSLKFGGDEGL